MASNCFTSVEKSITCAICSELFVDPRILPCLHTYCLRCINQKISTNQSHFECLFCNEMKITQNDIDSLPSNRMIDDIVQLYISMQRPILCSNCVPATNAQYLCDICHTPYCSECYQTVHKPRALQNHRRLPITKKVSDVLLCKTHTDEKLKYWCLECNTPLCSDCLLNQHKHHSHSVIHEDAKQLGIKIKTDLEMIQSSLDDKIKQANTSLNAIDTDIQSNKTKVIEGMAFLRQVIDEYEKQILKDIQNIQINQKQTIEEYKTKLENQSKYLDLQRNALDLLISADDQIRLLKNKPDFSTYVHQTNEILDKLQTPNTIDYYITGLDQLQIFKQQIIQNIRVTETSEQIIQNSIDEKPQIERLIKQYQTSRDVNLNGQSLTDENIHIITQILKNNTNMITLNISNNQIGHEGIQDLVDLLRHNKILTTLDLSNNQISDNGTQYLSDVLKTNTTLTILYLYDNGITPEGTQYLADALKDNTTITVLDLQSNKISHLGAQHLADALRINNTLTTLYLSNNQIGNQGAQYLADALQQHQTLSALTLSDNQIDHEAKRRVIEILKANTKLRIYW